MKKLRVIELFAGAGGLALGLEKAGLETIGLVEIDKNACKTLKTNRPKWNIFNEDIITLSEKNLEDLFSINRGELEVLSGGFPCQSFSYAGERRGLNDARGTMFYYYAIFLKKLYPKVFIAENVKGLVNHDKGRTLSVMLDVFREIGYTVQFKVLNSWDYNVAQKRERIFIIGVRDDLNDKIKFTFPDKVKEKPVLKDVLKDIPSSPGKKYNDYKKTIMDMVPPGGCWVDLPKEVAIEYMKGSYYLGGGKRGMARRLSFEEPSLTLTTSPDMKQTERCHPSETRPLTTREYARIQSFPDNWKFEGSINAVYKQIGNAVPVNLAFKVGESVIKAFERKK
jgi:DNA (cytosine-5)-methyltransferase 1